MMFQICIILKIRVRYSIEESYNHCQSLQRSLTERYLQSFYRLSGSIAGQVLTRITIMLCRRNNQCIYGIYFFKSLEPGTERSLTRERISIVDPNTGENIVLNQGMQEVPVIL